jgi:hypothetical protein
MKCTHQNVYSFMHVSLCRECLLCARLPLSSSSCLHPSLFLIISISNVALLTDHREDLHKGVNRQSQETFAHIRSCGPCGPSLM